MFSNIHFTKLFYAGANSHFQPVRDFPNTKEFIFIDSQPYTEGYYRMFDIGFYRKNFVQNIILIASLYDFHIISEEVIDNTFFWSSLDEKQRIFYSSSPIPPYVNPTLLTFHNNISNQYIKYYISTPLPLTHHSSHFQPLLNDLKSCDGAIFSGHFPNKQIIEYFPHKPICFIGYSGTCYQIDEYSDENDIFSYIVKEENNLFHSFLYVIDKVKSYENNLFHLWDENDNQEFQYEEIQKMVNTYIISNKPISDFHLFTSLKEFIDYYMNK